MRLDPYTPIPTPKQFLGKETFFKLDEKIAAPAEFRHCAEVLQGYIRQMFGLDFSVECGEPESGICLCVDENAPRESYRVLSENGLVRIFAGDTAGFSHGCAAVLQTAEGSAGKMRINTFEISDYPDVSWRGLMVDLARGNYSFEEVLVYLDICYFYRLSVLHLHFADSYDYKLPSKAFPKLNTGNAFDSRQIEQLRRYASERGIMLLPEIEMPGHANILTNTYPEIFGGAHSGTVCAGSGRLFEGLETLIGEVCELFPDSPYIHIGCDEVVYKHWQDCPHCREFMQKANLASAKEMYTYMVDICSRMVLSKGRTPVVWEGFPKEGSECLSRKIVVMVFQSTYQTAIELADAGFRVINTSWQPLYIVPSRPKYWEPDQVYRWRYNKWLYETATDDSEEMIVRQKDAVLGAQICLWEGRNYRSDGAIVEENTAVLAQRLWNEEQTVGYEVFAEQKAKTAKALHKMIDAKLAPFSEPK